MIEDSENTVEFFGGESSDVGPFVIRNNFKRGIGIKIESIGEISDVETWVGGLEGGKKISIDAEKAGEEFIEGEVEEGGVVIKSSEIQGAEAVVGIEKRDAGELGSENGGKEGEKRVSVNGGDVMFLDDLDEAFGVGEEVLDGGSGGEVEVSINR